MARYQNQIHVSLDPGRNYTGVANDAVKAGTFASPVDAEGRPGAWPYETATAESGVVGVFEFDSAKGEPCSIVKGGQVGMVAGGVIAPGDKLVSDATGRAVKAADATTPHLAVALNSATADAVVYINF